ncbi:FAD-binding protein [Nocardia sp. AG03]|uniref:FAD-binding oxidoreductase n=1 Tax=Nocardia sp. AG03 TaxID=3025312 RepID=UPI00241823FF|nr:FAD-binding protein [Nocardia sp. AG03]
MNRDNGGDGTAPAPDEGRIRPGDNRYADLCRAYNYRFIAQPEYFRLPKSTREVEDAVQQAVTAGKRLTVRSGGHCGEDFVAAPEVEVIIDLSRMRHVGFDAPRRAFVIESGATVGELVDELFRGWGVTIPCGFCTGVGAGGHLSGGGYGPLSRQLGLSVDYLHAVEVVVVDADRRASTVVATSDEDDPHRDLWWAHTGGGGGNFGIVTRYWLRIPEAVGTDPATLLPRPPGALHIAQLAWSWDELDEPDFVRLVGNFLEWQAANSAPDAEDIDLYALLNCMHRSGGGIALHAHLPENAPDAHARMDRFLAYLHRGLRLDPSVRRQTLPWLAATRYLAVPDTGLSAVALRCKVKSADLRVPHSPEQLAVAYRHLTRDGYQGFYSALEYIAYGGRVNTVAPTATAIPRGALLKTFYMVLWNDAADDDTHLSWIREFYREMHSGTGGVPVPGDTTTGAYINYADVDLADPAWNTSGVAWHEIYYGPNYRRLQEVKAAWDPRDVFRHTLSITAPVPSIRT